MTAAIARTTRAARPTAPELVLALYPRAWRERYGSEMVDVLTDVAEATEDGRLPFAEVTSLLVRGAVLRARTSIAFWSTIGVIGIFIWGFYSSLGWLQPTGEWNDAFVMSGTGLSLAFPLVAALAAIRGYRSIRRPASDARARLMQAASEIWPFVVGLAVGWLTALVFILSRVGIPSIVNGDVRILIALLAMSIGTVSVGYAIGSVVHPILAVPILFGAVFWWYLTPTWLGNDPLRWSNITGYNLFSYAPGTDGVVVPQALYLVPVASVVAIAISAAILVFRRRRFRAAIGTGIGLMLLVAVPLVSPALLRGVPTEITASRSTSELVCRGSAPAICAWPEQQPQVTAVAQRTLAGAYARAVSAGLAVPTAISTAPTTTAAILGHVPAKATRVSSVGWTQPLTAAALTINYATNLADNSVCATNAKPRNLLSAEYATAVTLGIPLGQSLPSISSRSPSATHDTRLTGARLLSYLHARSTATEIALARNWNSGRC